MMKKKVTKWLVSSIAGILILAWIGNFIYDSTKGIPVLKFITGVLNWCFDLITKFLNYELKVWIVLLALLALLVLSNIELDRDENFRDYKSDSFKNFLWRWDWEQTRKGWMITNLTRHCLKDGVRLTDDSTNYTESWYCPKCQTKYEDNWNPLESEEDVHSLIWHKIDTEYKRL